MAGGSYNLYFLAPTSGQTVFQTRFNTYTAVHGLITVSPPSQYDIVDLMQMGCIPVTNLGGGQLLGTLIGAALNSTSPQYFSMTAWAQMKCRPTKITVTNASANLSGAGIEGELYNAAGTAIVSTITTPMAALTSATVAEDLTLAVTAATQAAGLSMYMTLADADADADTADFYIFGDIYLP